MYGNVFASEKQKWFVASCFMSYPLHACTFVAVWFAIDAYLDIIGKKDGEMFP